MKDQAFFERSLALLARTARVSANAVVLRSVHNVRRRRAVSSSIPIAWPHVRRADRQPAGDRMIPSRGTPTSTWNTSRSSTPGPTPSASGGRSSTTASTSSITSYSTLLAHRKQLTDADLLAVTYYLLLQDRMTEALDSFGRVNPDECRPDPVRLLRRVPRPLRPFADNRPGNCGPNIRRLPGRPLAEGVRGQS